MTSKQFADLEAAIDQWANDACETIDWPDVVVGNQTISLMAIAARAVFEACEESQQFAIREGYVKSL